MYISNIFNQRRESTYYRSQEGHRINSLTHFLWWCGGTLSDILEECPTERVTYQCIGAAVFFTAVLAGLTGGYALFFVFDNPVYASIFGVFWGLLIFNLDRYIVASIDRRGHILRRLWLATPRIFLAVCIALIISKPLEMKIFEKEINQQLERDYLEKVADQEAFVQSQARLMEEKHLIPVREKIAAAEETLDRKRRRMDELHNALILEIQGVKGTGRSGDGPAARQIREFLIDTKFEVAGLQRELTRLRERETTLTRQTEAEIDRKFEANTRTIARSDGLLSRLTAIERLKATSRATWYIDIFLVSLFVFIEVAPVLIKIMSRKGIYDELEERTAEHEKKVFINMLER